MFTRDISRQLRKKGTPQGGLLLGELPLGSVQTSSLKRLCRKELGTRVARTGVSKVALSNNVHFTWQLTGAPGGTPSCLSVASRAQGLLAHRGTPQKFALRAALHLIFGDCLSLSHMATLYRVLCQEHPRHHLSLWQPDSGWVVVY